MALLLTAAASAETITLSQTFTGYASKTGDNSLIHIPLVFNQFNGTLGTLNSATLSFDLSGRASLDSSTCFAPDPSYCFAIGNFSATAPGNAATQNFDLEPNSPTANFSFLLNSPHSLGLAGLTGLGTVTVGAFDLDIILTSGLFPNAATGSVDGTVTLTYDYTTNPPDSRVPEPASLTLMLTGAAAVIRRKLSK